MFFPVGESFLEFQLVRRSRDSKLVSQRVAFVVDDDLLARTSFSHCLSAHFSRSLSLSLFLSLCPCLFLSALISPLTYPPVSSVRASNISPKVLRAPKINRFCQAVGLSSIILPASLSCSHHRPHFCDFFRWLRSSPRRNTRRLGCSLPHANLPRVTSSTNAYIVPVAQMMYCYLAIAGLHRSHIQIAYFSSRYVRVSIYTSPYPHRAKKRILVL